MQIAHVKIGAMAFEIQIGDPPEPGRYVVWTPCKSRQVREWCDPSIATWHGGKWHTYEPVWGWIGPLPLCNQATLSAEQFKREYDL